MIYWFDPIFPLDIIYNILNYLTILFVLVVIGVKYKTEKNILLLLVVTSIVPFLINGPLMPWWALADQSKFLRRTMLLRDFDFAMQEEFYTVRVPAYIFFFSPIPFIENFNAIGLLNRLYLALLIIFLARKKLNKVFIYYLILSPTLLLYSSSALKESIVLISSLLSLYCIIEKKYFVFWFPFLILLTSKFQNAYIVLLMYVSYIYCFSINFKLKKIINKILIFSILLLFIIYSELLTFHLNKFATSFLFENNTVLGSKIHIEYTNLINVFLRLPEKLSIFFLSPFPHIVSPIKLIIFIDNLFLILLIALHFKKLLMNNLKQFYFWFTNFLIFSSMYALTVVNHGTISRYRMSYFIPFLFILFYLDKKKNR